MNKLCDICDTRCRLGMCRGKDGDFQYCFRKTGSLSGLKETITPFNSLHELYEKCDWIRRIEPKSLIIDNKPYGPDNNMVLLLGVLKSDLKINKALGIDRGRPCGFITANVSEDMKKIRYTDEVK